MLYLVYLISGTLLLAWIFVGIFRYLQEASRKDEQEKKQREDKEGMHNWKAAVQRGHRQRLKVSLKWAVKERERLLRQIKVHGTWDKHLWGRALGLGFFITWSFVTFIWFIALDK